MCGIIAMIAIKKDSINSAFRAETEYYTFHAYAYNKDRKNTEYFF